MPPLKRQQQQQRVRTVLGTMSIPQQLDLEDTVRALEVFREAGHIEVDTAIMYEGGQTEKTLGELRKSQLMVTAESTLQIKQQAATTISTDNIAGSCNTVAPTRTKKKRKTREELKKCKQ